MIAAGYYRYWGKAQPGQPGSGFHRLVYHMLDVGAACKEFLAHDRIVVRLIASSTGLADTTVRSVLPFLAALHDLGKFAESFQDLRADLVATLKSSRSTAPYAVRHDRMGYMFWSDLLSRTSWDEEWPLASAEDDSDWDFNVYRDALDPWLRGVTGHHGVPPGLSAYKPASHSFSAEASADALQFVRDLRSLLRPDPLLFRDAESAEPALVVSAWSVAGLVVLCDWIGSNQAHFNYCDEIVPLDVYWERALQSARAALRMTGVLPTRPSTDGGMSGLFPAIAEPSPLQRHVEAIPDAEGPRLVIAEEVTGSGKTEAAIVLAHRWIVAGLADGLFVALPTMATADAMFRRLEGTPQRLYAGGPPASIVLTHSARHLDDAASDHCTLWLADHRKKALLAQVGVGTIDQALLAVLPAKHNVLRLLGLQRSVLIVDEVHAYDAYVSRILERLLEFHAALGGSAILLSATLPRSMRQRYVDAFAKGLGSARTLVREDAYPLVTEAGGGRLRETSLETRRPSRRSVRIQFLETVEDVGALIERAANDGSAVCWIRNSVNDAIEAFELMRDRIGEESVTLFHARFMMGDRREKERAVMSRFGPRAGRAERERRVVIATQVVEQSLDLDFDVMVSDLAPIDLLIQRAGRLHRHSRDAQGNPIDGPDRRESPVLHILAPQWSDEPSAGWLSATLPRTAYVYGHVGQLWLSMKILRERGQIAVPDEARLLIESVYGETVWEDLPKGLQAVSDRFEGEQRAKASVAGFNTLVVNDGFKSTPTHWIDDAVTPTRLSEPTTTVRLATERDGAVVPLFDDAKHPWEMSQLSVRSALVATRITGSAEVEERLRVAEEAMRDKGKWSVTLVVQPVGPGTWRGSADDANGRRVEVRYDSRTGLVVRKETSA